MWKNRLSYLMLCIVMSIFCILYTIRATLIVTIGIILFPVVGAWIVFYLSKYITSSFTLNQHVFQCGEEAEITLRVENQGIFPISRINLSITLENSLFQVKELRKFSLSMSGRSCQEIIIKVTSEYSGIIKIKMNQLRLFDYTECFSYRSGQVVETQIQVFPKVSRIEEVLDVGDAGFLENEEAFFSKPGDDPTEILQIREYQPGDHFSRIHWKLSNKLDQYMVKEYASTLSYYPILLLDTRRVDGRSKDEIESIYKILYALSMWHIEASAPFEMGFYNGQYGGLVKHKVSNIEDLYLGLQQAYESCYCSLSSQLLQQFYVAEDEKVQYSNVVYFTTKLDTDTAILEQEEVYTILVGEENEDNKSKIGKLSYCYHVHMNQIDLDLVQIATSYLAWNRGELSG